MCSSFVFMNPVSTKKKFTNVLCKMVLFFALTFCMCVFWSQLCRKTKQIKFVDFRIYENLWWACYISWKHWYEIAMDPSELISPQYALLWKCRRKFSTCYKSLNVWRMNRLLWHWAQKSKWVEIILKMFFMFPPLNP